MTDDYACQIDGCEYSGTPTGLRSHVGGTQDDAHRTARETQAYREWYPRVDWSTNPPRPPAEGGGEGEADQGDERSSDGTDTAAASDPDEPSDSSGVEDPYTAQYEGGGDGGSSGGSGTGSAADGSSDGGRGGDDLPVGWGTIVAGTAAVAHLLSRSGDDGGTAGGTAPSGEGSTPDDENDGVSEGVGLIE